MLAPCDQRRRSPWIEAPRLARRPLFWIESHLFRCSPAAGAAGAFTLAVTLIGPTLPGFVVLLPDSVPIVMAAPLATLLPLTVSDTLLLPEGASTAPEPPLPVLAAGFTEVITPLLFVVLVVHSAVPDVPTVVDSPVVPLAFGPPARRLGSPTPC